MIFFHCSDFYAKRLKIETFMSEEDSDSQIELEKMKGQRDIVQIQAIGALGLLTIALAGLLRQNSRVSSPHNSKRGFYSRAYWPFGRPQ